MTESEHTMNPATRYQAEHEIVRQILAIIDDDTISEFEALKRIKVLALKWRRLQELEEPK